MTPSRVARIRRARRGDAATIARMANALNRTEATLPSAFYRRLGARIGHTRSVVRLDRSLARRGDRR